MISFFTNREWATIAWFTIIALWTVCRAPKSVGRFLKCLFDPKLLVIFIGGYAYLSICIWIFYKTGLWNMLLIKETVLYVLASVFLVGKSLEQDNNEKLFRSQVLDNMKATTIIAYIVNIYSFGFWTEFILLLVVTFFTMMDAYTAKKTEEQLQKVNSLAKIVLFLAFFIYVIGFFVWLFGHWQVIFSVTNFYGLLLPIVFSIMFIPYMYGVSLFSSYEEIFTRLKVLSERTNLDYKYRRNLIFKVCGLNIRRIKSLHKQFHQYLVEDDAEFECYVRSAVTANLS